MEVVWVPLDGQNGTGPGLDAAVENAASSATSPGGGSSSSRVAVQAPLRRERDGHRRASAAAAAAGLQPPQFEAWVLWEDDGSDLAVSSPTGSGLGHSRGRGAASPTLSGNIAERQHKLSGSIADDPRPLVPVATGAALSQKTATAEGVQLWLT